MCLGKSGDKIGHGVARLVRIRDGDFKFPALVLNFPAIGG